MAFLSQPREVLSRDYLIVQTQGAHRYTTSRTLDVYVSRLRRRLRAGRRCANVIGTRYKLGYVFNADPVFEFHRVGDCSRPNHPCTTSVPSCLTFTRSLS
jgi:DNA-binding winged helix-turn-helix (wHTH) protein